MTMWISGHASSDRLGPADQIYGLYSYGLYSYGRYSYGRYSHGLRIGFVTTPIIVMADIVLADMVMADTVMADIVMADIVMACGSDSSQPRYSHGPCSEGLYSYGMWTGFVPVLVSRCFPVCLLAVPEVFVKRDPCSGLPLAVQGHVAYLIDEASSQENLCRMYKWWMPWN